MNIIENFDLLSEAEQKVFAENLVDTINSKKTFFDTTLKIEEVYADSITGDLCVVVYSTEAVNVPRKASWSGNDFDDIESTDSVNWSDIEFENYSHEDVANMIKTTSAELDGYNVTVEVDEVDSGSIVSLDVTEANEDDYGIGSYEYFGATGYDSQPYVEASGTVVESCTFYLTLTVSPIV